VAGGFRGAPYQYNRASFFTFEQILVLVEVRRPIMVMVMVMIMKRRGMMMVTGGYDGDNVGSDDDAHNDDAIDGTVPMVKMITIVIIGLLMPT
jgi:hypothetical protein